MTHDLFGKLRYKDADECWAAWLPLGRFAALGMRPPEPPLSDEQARQMLDEMNTTLDSLRGMLRQQLGDAADQALADIDRQDAADDEPDPAEQARQRKRQERAAKRAERLGRGLYPVRIADPAGDGPTPQQEAAIRFLGANEPAVLDAVTAQAWESFQHAYQDEHWRKIAGVKSAASPDELRGRFAFPRVELTREHRGGLAHLVFTVEADWQDEHGLLIVYSPDTREAAWTSHDGLDELLEADEVADDGPEWVPTPHDELVEAVLNGEEERARELVAAGADINELAADEYPPLCMAVDQLEVEEVRRLLAFGADPNLPDPDEQKTPLKMAKRIYREMGFGTAKKNDALFQALMTMARESAGKQFDDMKTRLEEIIRRLTDAGGK